MKYLTKIVCSLFNDREVTLGMITDNFLKAFAIAFVWNLFGLGYARDMNLVPEMFTILYGGFLYLSLVILLVIALWCSAAILFYCLYEKTAPLRSKLDNIKDIVIFKCKK